MPVFRWLFDTDGFEEAGGDFPLGKVLGDAGCAALVVIRRMAWAGSIRAGAEWGNVAGHGITPHRFCKSITRDFSRFKENLTFSVWESTDMLPVKKPLI